MKKTRMVVVLSLIMMIILSSCQKDSGPDNSTAFGDIKLLVPEEFVAEELGGESVYVYDNCVINIREIPELKGSSLEEIMDTYEVHNKDRNMITLSDRKDLSHDKISVLSQTYQHDSQHPSLPDVIVKLNTLFAVAEYDDTLINITIIGNQAAFDEAVVLAEEMLQNAKVAK